AQEILWDLFDANNDGADTVQVPFAQIWQVLTNGERTTSAETSIFSFITALKAVATADAAGIDALMNGEAIHGTDEFAANETNDASASPSTNVLPVYKSISIGDGGQTVVSTNAYDPGKDNNKLSEHRFLKLVVPAGAAQNVRITATATSP